MLHFVVVASPSPLSGRVGAVLDAARPPTRPPGADGSTREEHVSWRAGGVALALWSDDGRPWTIDDDGVLALAGAATDRVAPADGLLARVADAGPQHTRGLDGMFTVVRVMNDGTGWLRSDRFGLAPVYRRSVGGLTVLSNRPALVAAVAAAAGGGEPTRDLVTAMDVATLGTAFGDDSGFAGIRRVPDRHDVDLVSGRVVEVTTWPQPWDGAGSSIAGSPDAIVAGVEDRLVESTAAWIEGSAGAVEAELTGGLDSRLVLALLRLAGLERDVAFHTFGPRGGPDARAAQHLAAQHGLTWEMRRARGDESTREGLLDRVASVSGEFGAGGITPPRRGGVLLSGMMGEALAAKYRNSKPASLARAQARIADQISRNQPFVTPTALATVIDKVGSALADSVAAGCPPVTALDAFYLAHRERRWIGARPDRWDRNLFPLYSPDAIAANLQLPVDDRHRARIHESILAAAGLTSERFDVAALPPAPAPPPLEELPARPWGEVLQAVARDCADSPLRDRIDVGAVIDAAGRYPDLDRITKQKLTDVITALAWSLPDVCPTVPVG